MLNGKQMGKCWLSPRCLTSSEQIFLLLTEPSFLSPKKMVLWFSVTCVEVQHGVFIIHTHAQIKLRSQFFINQSEFISKR